ncbi:MAG: iron-containing alcohol dehydrogenase [Sedimentisphaerales bacterium]|nr:iron-containing alcohol dehydrogenase [Sedimentisphaerales bacterium]
MRFEFSTVDRIVFGPGAADELARGVGELGGRAFVLVGSNPHRLDRVLDQLASVGTTCEIFHITGEPTTEMAQAAILSARRARSHTVIAIGGGSVIDVGKAVAAMLTNEGELLDYLEVVGAGRPLREKPVPYVAVPTTAGTGAEVTRNAVLRVPQHRVKVSMRSRLLLPQLAMIDPLLTHSMPPQLTASTGLDALTQLIEPFVSNKANPVTDGICREGLSRAGRSLRRAFRNGDDAEAREDMAVASLFSGLALANAALGAVHGFAGPLGGATDAPHGVICGKLLPFVMEFNAHALQTRAPDSPTLARFDEVARILTGKTSAKTSDAVAWIQELCAEFSLPGLGTYGLSPADLPAIAAQAKKASSMKGNPIELHDDELLEILEAAMA